MPAEFSDVSQVVGAGLALAALGTAAEQYMIQNLSQNRRLVLKRQSDEFELTETQEATARKKCEGKDATKRAKSLVEMIEKYRQIEEDLKSTDVQASLMFGFASRTSRFHFALPATYIYILSAIIYAFMTHLSGVHLTKMGQFYELFEGVLGWAGITYSQDILLNIAIWTLFLQTLAFAWFMGKSISIRNLISDSSENLRSLGELIMTSVEFIGYSDSID